MRVVPVTGARADAWRDVLQRHATMQDVLDWCRAQSPPRDIASVVAQDEFTHDVVVPLRDGLFAVYDTT